MSGLNVLLSSSFGLAGVVKQVVGFEFCLTVSLQNKSSRSPE